MSQFFIGTTSGNLPPSVAEEFDTQNGNAVPLAHILIIDGIDSTENNDNGIITKGGVVGTGVSNEVDVVLTNRQTGTVTTNDATLTTIITFSMGATPGTFYVYGNIQAFNSSTPASGAYSFTGGYRTDGATGTELGVEIHDEFEDAALVTADIFLSTSGNNILVQVQGPAGLVLNWNALLEFRRVV